MGKGFKIQRRTPAPAPEWGGELYDYGNEYEDVTGGWVYGYSAGTGTLSKQTDHMLFTTNSSTAQRFYRVNNTIDLTDYTTLYAEVESSAYALFMVVGTATTVHVNSMTAQIDRNTTYGKTVISIDVSALNGSYYIAIGGYGGAPTAMTFKAYKVWLEV